MAKSISVKRKKRGRPATGTEPLYGIRVSDVLMREIMQWARSNGMTRSEAIRRLVKMGLKASVSTDQTSQIKASESASKARKLELGLKAKK
jgi:hypothetical protein